jgi:hypothetical protein
MQEDNKRICVGLSSCLVSTSGFIIFALSITAFINNLLIYNNMSSDYNKYIQNTLTINNVETINNIYFIDTLYQECDVIYGTYSYEKENCITYIANHTRYICDDNMVPDKNYTIIYNYIKCGNTVNFEDLDNKLSAYYHRNVYIIAIISISIFICTFFSCLHSICKRREIKYAISTCICNNNDNNSSDILG